MDQSTCKRTQVIDLTPAKRCSSYDEDCVAVTQPYLCWCGVPGMCEPADGYCPMLGKHNEELR
jgi:hypothetical protein